MTHASRRDKPRRRSPLRVTDGFRAFVLEQLRDAGDITPRDMFGGVGLYCDGLFFGIIASDVLYLKVDDSTRVDYEAQGMSAFRPYPRDRAGLNRQPSHGPRTMQYYEVPLAILESPVDLAAWAKTAVKVASRAASATRRRSRKGSF